MASNLVQSVGIQNHSVGIAQFLPLNLKEVNEEQLYIAAVSQQISLLPNGGKLVEQFRSKVSEIVADASKSKRQIQLEEAGQQALSSMTQSKELTKTQAESVSQIAWTAAQLDDNPALWDSIDGKNDPTKATASYEQAIASVEKNLISIKDKKLSLIEPTKMSSNYTLSGNNLNQFLWKPEANSSGTASVLIPSELGKQATSVKIIGSDNKEIDRGRFTSFGDDGTRAKYIFTRPGKEYPAGSSIAVTLQSGEVISIKLDDPSKRLEKK